jgi:hypothetical protein
VCGKALEVAIGIDSGMAIRRRPVMLIVQKLLDPAIEILRYAQDDKGWV